MATHPLAMTRVTSAMSCSATIPPSHEDDAVIALQPARARSEATATEERMRLAQCRASQPGRPPDGGT